MMHNFGKLIAVATIASAIGLGADRTARASVTLDVTIQISGTNTPYTATVTTDSNGNYSETFYVNYFGNTTYQSSKNHDLYSITISGSTNAPGTSGVANLLDTSTGASQDETGTKHDQVTVSVSYGSFTQPTGSVSLQDTLSITSFSDPGAPGNDDSVTGAASYNNGAKTASVSSGTLDPTHNPPTFPLTLPTSTTGPFNSSGSFSLANSITFNFGGDDGDSATAHNTAQLVSNAVPAPEPSTIALAISGLGAIGLIRLRRSRAKKASA